MDDSIKLTSIEIAGTNVQLVPITNKVVRSNTIHGKVYSIQQYVIKFVCDLQQVSGFLRALGFPPIKPIKLTATICNILRYNGTTTSVTDAQTGFKTQLTFGWQYVRLTDCYLMSL
jgi:hypothetical protein